MSLIKMAKQIADLALKSIGKGNTVKGLTLNQTKMLLQALAKRESGGDYTAENSYGYLGAYQFGAAALVDVGLIQKDKYAAAIKTKPGIASGANAVQHRAFLANAENWVLVGGKSAFLNSKMIQDDAVIKLMNRNARTMEAKGVYQGSAAHKAGLLFAAHLKGVGNAIKFAQNGTTTKDGYGTSIKEYYELGRKSITGVI
ncbi:peptidoglycan-binding protein LysM [Actinobacillus equuli subsp. haemolyticus]|uniref:peptidoglycan-binding protein LysM n=1 Tax=Actinobacillus equuli TaxID=718 RepID=UPI0024433ED9|nr:peptidoglycan-binding protein LysM [Actinobacillus equuli]WGE68210.1 peptidoglycan-binding protein LysM [Actinobacillus equuli subsp. haemolyticus]WGE82114.1 peptidoglycan-binding protein LysM [Actinobacillus equuli subsp. haemolyticus]WGE84249.1 peptidoglycan-binding protein LysM [Actinobacillus equuli subsp. equuli]